jgi:hypothetical protein
MRIQDPALGKYSIQVGISKYVVYDGERSVTTLSDFNEALREVARRIVNDKEDVVTLAEFNAITNDVFENIKRSYELIPLTAEELAQHEAEQNNQ